MPRPCPSWSTSGPTWASPVLQLADRDRPVRPRVLRGPPTRHHRAADLGDGRHLPRRPEHAGLRHRLGRGVGTRGEGARLHQRCAGPSTTGPRASSSSKADGRRSTPGCGLARRRPPPPPSWSPAAPRSPATPGATRVGGHPDTRRWTSPVSTLTGEANRQGQRHLLAVRPDDAVLGRRTLAAALPLPRRLRGQGQASADATAARPGLPAAGRRRSPSSAEARSAPGADLERSSGVAVVAGRWAGRRGPGCDRRSRRAPAWKPVYSTGITGQSSGRGMWVTPNVCHTTTSVSTRSRSAAVHAGSPSPPACWFGWSPAARRSPGS